MTNNRRFTYIDSIEKLDALFAESFERPVALLKHSNSCGISSHVKSLIEEAGALVHIIVIQTHRDLSNEVARRTGHQHQSPQAFVLKDGEAIYHATHYGIEPERIVELLKS